MKGIVFAALFVLAGCRGSGVSKDSRSAEFDRLANRFMASHYAARPLEAVALGLHEHDGRFLVPDQQFFQSEITRLNTASQKFSSLQTKRLSPDQQRELKVLQSAIATARWTLDSIQTPSRNPMYYAGALDVSVYLKRDFVPLRDRVRMITSVLSKAPDVFAAARQTLLPDLALPLIETAIEITEGTAGFLEKDVAAEVVKSGDLAAAAEYTRVAGRAVTELRAYADWLRKTRLPTAHPRFAIGTVAYAEMLRTELIDLSPAEVLAIGLTELRIEQARFIAAARLIDPARTAAEVFKEVQHDHPTEQSLLSDTRRGLETIRAFVLERDLLTIPSEVRAQVEATLPPFRSTSFASMDTPGPFERKATEAYYYVTPPEPEWPQSQKEEWLTAYNYYTTDVVSIHETYPGHYVQFLALNASTIGPVGKVFVSYAFSEGWAHYTEQLLIESGFGGPKAAEKATIQEQVRGAKYRLAQSSEALLRLCRLCCSVKLHCEKMTVDEATRFFMENAFYEMRPAHSEALRGTYDPGYCFYTLGKLQILKLRNDVRDQEGASFSLKRFHDNLLAHGGPPIRVLREILLKNPASWPQVL